MTPSASVRPSPVPAALAATDARRLSQAVARGDEEAFNQLYDAYSDRVLRRKRHARHLTLTLAVAAFAGLAALAINRMTALRSPASIAGPRLAATQPARAMSHVQEISDDELLALFPGTPVGLAKVNGKQRLIFPRPGDEARFIERL